MLRLSPLIAVALVLAGCGTANRVAPIAAQVAPSKPTAKAVTTPRPTAGTPAPTSSRAFLTTLDAGAASFAPDGTAMVFAAGADGARDLVTARPDGTQTRALLGGATDDHSPAWSPAGGAVAFVRQNGQGAALMLLEPAKGAPTLLLDSREAVLDPAWLPGNRGWVFFTENAGKSVLYRLDGAGGSPVALWRGVGGRSPSVSPDGATIVFETATGLMRLGPDGRNLGVLAVAGTRPRQPAFSPSGQSLAYAAADGVYVARADGTGASRVATDAAVSGPRWHPRAAQLLWVAPRPNGHDLQVLELPRR